MLGVIDPAALQLQRLAHLHAQQLADDCDQVILAARLHASDCVAILLAVVGDAFEDSFECWHSAACALQVAELRLQV